MRRRHHGAAVVVAVAACAALAMPALGAPTTGSMGIPIISAGAERVRWTLPPATPAIADGLAARLRAARDRGDSLAAWGTALGDSVLRPYALRRVAGLQLAIGDSAGADRAWAALARERSIWHWEALRGRSTLALARRDTAEADSALERQERSDWPAGERAEWLALRIVLRLALRDTTTATKFAGQMVVGYPLAPEAPRWLRLLEALNTARGDSMTLELEERAALSERLQGRREAALARLTRLVARTPTSRLHYERARVLGELRRFAEAREAADKALTTSRGARDSVFALSLRAWNHRQAGDERAAMADYAAAIRLESPRDPSVLRVRGRYHEELGQWRAARADYARVALATGEEASAQASLRAGLMSLAVGEPDQALRWFSRSESEAARFWRGVVLRRTRPASGDSLLRTLALLPGYSFYRSAARDTLGVRGWSVAPVPIPAGPEERGLRLARALDQLGCPDDAAVVLDRWVARDERLARLRVPPHGRFAGAWVEAAGIAYEYGRVRQAIRIMQRAASDLPGAADSYDWYVWPWLYPPAHDSLFAAWPESAAAGRVDRALLQAVAWKESHFDPLARSRSDAFGLLQLKRPAVQDVARWLRESPPSDSALADPALNLRYGAEYLQRQLTRFKGDLPLALAAYNAGPTVAKRWTRLRALGGDALACEEIDFPETQDYVKTILAVRQAYRELRPVPAR